MTQTNEVAKQIENEIKQIKKNDRDTINKKQNKDRQRRQKQKTRNKQKTR